MRWLAGLTLLVLFIPVDARAQDELVLVKVRDTQGIPIPYALVQQPRGSSRVASDSGVAEFRIDARDSLRFIVRRIGFSPFDGWLRADSAGGFNVSLAPLPRMLTVVKVSERANTPLARTGFYDRMERVRRGATVARFITPEELDLRNPARISNVLQGENIVKVNYSNGKVLLGGRSRNCPMTVLLDGRKVPGMVEEVYTKEGADELTEIMRSERVSLPEAMDRFIRRRLSVDELVISAAVAAVEIYSSAAGVPAELQQNMAADACGLIALWTGARQ